MSSKLMLILGGILGVIIIIFVVLGGESRNDVSSEDTSTPVNVEAQALFDHAQAKFNQGQRLEAKQTFQQLMAEHPDFEGIEEVQQQITAINVHSLFSNNQHPECTVVHEVVSGDTLGKLAKQYGTTIELIKARNDLDSNLIRVGRKFSIWTCDFNVFVDKSQNILMLKRGDEVYKVYDVATGKDNNTPIGEYKITTKLVDPVWFKSGAVVAPDSPANVLGTRWMGFDLTGYGIHGTTEPDKIGQQATAGCVRMLNEDVEELYKLLTIGTKVVVVD